MNVRDEAAWRNCVDLDVQARYLREAYAKMREWSYVPVGVWFKLRTRAVIHPTASTTTGS
jgi:hypothetical protein